MGGTWSWVKSHQQTPDGFAGTAAKDKFHESLRRGVRQLSTMRHSPRPKRQQDKKKMKGEQELREASRLVNVMTAEEENGEKGVCLAEGCEKKANKGSNAKNRFCSRRNFYKHMHGVQAEGEVWKNMALRSAAIVAMQELAMAEARKVSEVKEEEGVLKYVDALVLDCGNG